MTYFMDPMPKRKPHQHRVLMNYTRRPEGYRISFLEEDCKTALPRKLTFATADKILEMQERWGETKTEEARSTLECDIMTGRHGSTWLILSAEQYAKLKK